jgi:excisionase family DNA binding protein
MNYHEAADYLRVPAGTLRSMVSHRTIPHVRISPRVVSFLIADLDAWIAKHRVTTKRQ